MTNTTYRIRPQLRRYPRVKRDLLKAWDAADELILEHLAQPTHAPSSTSRVLIVNDSFGALACAITEGAADLDVTSYTDSYVSARGAEMNSAGRVKPISRLEELSGTYDLVVIRVPKTMSYLEDILCRLSNHLRPGSRVVCGYMVKHQANTAFDLLDRYIGQTSTSLARKKARLIFATFERQAAVSPYPGQVKIEGFEAPFVNHSNLFSRERLDLGTRFLLDHIPTGGVREVLDIGCGNGILGIAAKRANPNSRIIFTDDSRMAIESARANYEKLFGENADAPERAPRFAWTHAYEEGKADSLDLVLCNPPFHQGTTLGDFTARQMFADAQRTLRSGGKIRVIGNTHLKHHVSLRQLFGESRLVASNPKFMIVEAVKRAQ